MSQANYKSWPFKEAFKLQKRYAEPPAGPVRFETGFGPSGLPHIGTFAEIARTTWIRRAFEFLTQRQTQLIAFSDDMDGLRKVPLNIRNKKCWLKIWESHYVASPIHLMNVKVIAHI